MAKKSRESGIWMTLVLATVIVVLSTAIGIGLSRFADQLPVVGPLFAEQPVETTTSPVVVEGIRDLNQLSTVQWTESVVVTREDAGSELQRFFAGEKIVLVAAGEVEAGVNLDELGREDVRVDEETVTIDLPEAEILSSSLDEENTRVYDRDRGVFRLQPDEELVQEARVRAEEDMRAAARENGILDYAETNAENSVRGLAMSLGFEEVRFE